MDRTLSSYGIVAAIAEIRRRNAPTSLKAPVIPPAPSLSYEEAEARLADRLYPARLAPLQD